MSNQEIGNRIRHLRIQKEYKQEVLAARLNVTNSAISKYESGTSALSLEAVVKLAGLFNVTTDYLLTGKDADFGETSSDLLGLITLLKRLPADKRQRICHYFIGVISTLINFS